MKKLTREQIQKQLEKENAQLKKLLGDMAAFSVVSAAGQEQVIVEDSVINCADEETGKEVTKVIPNGSKTVVKPTLTAKVGKKVVDNALSPIWQVKVENCRARIKELEEILATFEKGEDTPNM